MTTIATAHLTSAAAPAAFFARWADMATWPEWNADTEWVVLDGPFTQGATGTLKPRGGPKVAFTVELLDEHAFVDVSRLVGARLTFDHRIAPRAGGGSDLSVSVALTGPLRPLWMAILGKGIRDSLQRDLDALGRAAESNAPMRPEQNRH
ncbi:SRPBCC family protein [Jatrophihabitans telluris]|uniref:SRPBCC family protein n=1 Tax=Jatrophihabitans telluris TaxID=2038343 RepID=A0ABY4R139_9ACTN|nr:SRPBCC family protein [Jatrophihabitans telluris]UQX89323.1 SRPBCC family protein [Jatrophihabitans telluris]